MSAVTDAYLATNPFRYLPLDETGGSTARELVANETGVVSGMTMGGADAFSGIGGKCPLFTGAGSILLRSAAILGGLSAWSVAAWVRHDAPSGDLAGHYFYGEAASAGNDFVGVGISGNNPNTIQHVYGADSGVTTLGAQGVYIWGLWTFVVITRSGSTVEAWFNIGRRNQFTTAIASSTWTNAGVTAKIGAPTRLAGFKGPVAHVALYDRVLSQADQRSIYYACTPLTRPNPTRQFWAPNAIWNQSLTDPSNIPDVAANSADIGNRLAGQASGYLCGANASTGPFYTATSATSPQRVRISGGQNNIAAQPMELWTAMGHVPIPPNFDIPVISDREGQIYVEDTDELYEFFLMEKTLTQPAPLNVYPGTASGQSLPPGLHVWAVLPALADETYGKWAFISANISSGQHAFLAWGESEGVDHYRVMRLTTGGVLPWGLVALVPAGTLTYLDTGSSWTALSVTAADPTAHTTDWGASYAGYVANTDDSLGFYPSNHWNWGPAASGMPLWGGSISLHEARNYNIPHAIAMGLPEIDVSGHVFPAQRNDGADLGGNSIMEGVRLQLNPAYDTSQIPYKFERAVAEAAQEYGAIIRDATVRVSVYIEDQYSIGRDWYPEIFEGRFDFELFQGFSFPWSQFRVIEPDWTETQTLEEPPPGDTTPPNTTITSGPSGTTHDNTPAFTFTATEAATFECRIDAGAWGACTTPWTTPALPDGAHTVSVRATDAAGNTDLSPATQAFTIDTSVVRLTGSRNLSWRIDAAVPTTSPAPITGTRSLAWNIQAPVLGVAISGLRLFSWLIAGPPPPIPDPPMLLVGNRTLRWAISGATDIPDIPVPGAPTRFAIHWFWEPCNHSEMPDPPETCPECGSPVVVMMGPLGLTPFAVFTRHYQAGSVDTDGTMVLEDCPYIDTINEANYAQPLPADIQAGYVLTEPVP